MDGLAFVDEGGIAGDDEEPPQLGQSRDDVLADAVGKILLFGFAAHIDEGEHRNGRAVGQRQRCTRLVELVGRGGFVRRLVVTRGRVHVADKAQSFARNCADQLLVLAAVAHRLARGVDAAGQGRVRDDPVAPDCGNEIVLADDAVAVLHQINEQIEHLRLDGDDVVAPAELAPIGVKPMAGKQELHVAALHLSRNNQACLTHKSR